jgi:hypothetical protein
VGRKRSADWQRETIPPESGVTRSTFNRGDLQQIKFFLIKTIPESENAASVDDSIQR